MYVDTQCVRHGSRGMHHTHTSLAVINLRESWTGNGTLLYYALGRVDHDTQNYYWKKNNN